VNKARLTAHDIAAIGIANQRETTVGVGSHDGQPICNAIVWQDRRTAAACDRLKARGHAKSIRQKTGLVVDAYFSGTKLQWILNNVPGAKAKAKAGDLAFGTVDSWLVWNLTADGSTSLIRVTLHGQCCSTFAPANGMKSCSRFLHPARGFARGAFLERGVWRNEFARRLDSDCWNRRAISKPRCSARSARGPAW
jgi:ribulose kinase